MIRQWCANQEKAARNAGVSLRISGHALKEQMQQAGFENISVRAFKIPIGIWPRDEKMKRIGVAQMVAMLEGIEALTLGFWVNCLGWKEEEVQVALALTRPEFEDKKIHSYWPLYVALCPRHVEHSSLTLIGMRCMGRSR